jgi:hypothetical protein
MGRFAFRVASLLIFAFWIATAATGQWCSE